MKNGSLQRTLTFWLEPLFAGSIGALLCARKLEWNFLSHFFSHIRLRSLTKICMDRDIVEEQVCLDVDVAVSFAEEVCGQLILNAYAHQAEGYHGLTMPRSWIIRAFFRGPTSRPNGALPLRLTAALGELMDVLLLNKEQGLRFRPIHCYLVDTSLIGRFLLEGVPLGDVSLGARNHVISRLCRCLTLGSSPCVCIPVPGMTPVFKVGQNVRNDALRIKILAMLKGVDFFSTWPSLQKYARKCNPALVVLLTIYIRYSTARTWTDVVAAMTSGTNRLRFDEIVTISREGGVLSGVLGQRIFGSDEKKILQKLMITSHTPAIVSLITPTRRQTFGARGKQER